MDMQTELRGEILHATLTGKVGLSSSVRLVNQALEIAAEARTYKVLFDVLALTGTLSTIERYELGLKVAKHLAQLGTNPKLAFVGALPVATGFGVQVAQNRDVAVELFRSIPEALAWLDSWPAPDKPGSVPS